MSLEKVNGLTFMQWLKKQQHRDDPIGDLSRDTHTLRHNFKSHSHSEVLAYLEELGAPEAITAAKSAHEEWRSGTVTIKAIPATINKAEKLDLAKKVATIAVNHLIKIKALSLNPDITINKQHYSFDAGGVLGITGVREVSFSEVHLNVALWPKAGIEEWIGSMGFANTELTYAGAAFSTHIERRTGAFLQISKDNNNLIVDRYLLGGLRLLRQQSPNGFRQAGRLL